MNAFRQDVRYALRRLNRNRGFALTAILTLTLGVGAATTIFSFVNSILLRPLGYPEPQRIVAVWPGKWLSKPVFKRLKKGVSLAEAEQEFRALTARARQRFSLPDEWDASARLVPFHEHLVGEVRPALLLLLGAAGLLLLIANAFSTAPGPNPKRM